MSIAKYFDDMSYGLSPESDAEARSWLARHDHSFGHFIAGAFTQPEHSFQTHEPATGKPLARLAQGTAADVDAAVAAARKAQGPWAKLPGHARARHLYALARMIQRHARLIAVVEAIDNGKPIRETRDIDVPLAARHFTHHAGWAQLQDSSFPDHVPVGVVGQIIPWNFPFLMLAWKLAPALALGNTVVLKPAEYTSLTALLFAELAAAAGLPAGVVNIVTGAGETGALIVDHPGIDKIAFTGSTDVGRQIRQRIAGSGKALTLELGGKSPFIVFDDADIDAAVEGVVDAIWFNQGQVCCAGSRLYVQRKHFDNVVADIAAIANDMKLGNGLDPSVQMGPLISAKQQDRVTGYINQGRELGATVACGGEGFGPGYFVQPTVLVDVDQRHRLVQEEIFGPVLVAMPFDDIDEAVRLANDNRYGLGASIWSNDLAAVHRMIPRIKSGSVWVNCHSALDPALPFGGYKMSGIGREMGAAAIEHYTELKSVLIKL